MKLVFMVTMFLLIQGVLFSQGTSTMEDERDMTEQFFNIQAGISVIPLTYWHFIQAGPTNLKYDFDRTRSITYEANLRLGIFSSGGYASVENITGRLDTILGYIGISSVSLRISEGSISGSGEWSGPLGSDMKRNFKFDDRIRSYDLVYNGDEKLIPGLKSWFAGITYTELTVPMEISVDVQPVSGYLQSGNPVYDEKFRLKSIGFVFGFDMLKDKNRKQGFDIFAASHDRFNLYNRFAFSDRAVARALDMNPGYDPERTTGTQFYPVGAGYLDNETTIGICWTNIFSGGHVTFAVGYDLVWGLISGPWGDLPGKGEMSLEGDNMIFFRHGVIFRVYGIW